MEKVMTPAPALDLQEVGVRIAGGPVLLQNINWLVRPGEQWALLGPNGAGKSTLLSLAGAVRHPTTGTADVLGRRLGRTDMRELRGQIGVVDTALRMPARMTVLDVVLTGATGTVLPLPERYTAADHERARMLLDRLGMMPLADREIGACSHGERARARLARALVPDPPLLLLDEPATGLDLPSRETLLATLDEVAKVHPDLAMVLVSHHLEELPATTSHALLLRAGAAVAVGPADEVLTDEPMSRCFGLPLAVRREHGRWSVVARRD
jgi:iron complex transport system ATP-binding protein